ncbi:hypothetical protein AEL97_11190, partial [Lactobacillus crispatus]
FMRYWPRFPSGMPAWGAGSPRVSRPSAARFPNVITEVNLLVPLARLACIRHAASVRPEPGSNSHFKKFE